MIISPFSPTEVVVRGDDRLREWRESQAVSVPGARFTPRYKSGRWDGLTRPGKWCKKATNGGWVMRCSRGLIPRLLSAGATLDPALESCPLSTDEMTWLQGFRDTLRDYQIETLASALTRRWGRAALATNAGKGAIIALLSSHVARTGGRTVILTDEVAVFDALVGEVEKWGDQPIGRVESGLKEPPGESVVLAMIPTLHRRLQGDDKERWQAWASEFQAALLDEADKATAATWRSTLALLKNTDLRVGFSGSFPTDAHGVLLMDELMGPELTAARNIELVERGISARPKVLLRPFDAGPFHQPLGWRKMSGPEKRLWVYDAGVVQNDDRHAFILSLLRPGVPTCVIVNRVAHGEALQETIPDSRYLSGDSPKAERTAVLDSFTKREFDVLIVTKILDRGTNRLGHAVDIIFASGEGSKRQTLQRIGRGLRRTEGKEFLLLTDVVDRGHRYLHRAAEKRLRTYNDEGFEVEIRRS